MKEYEAVIGMEVHVESKTKSKMFCACVNGLGLEDKPNIHICPICTGHPGTLPVPNREALVKLARFGQALNCQISEYTWFERKSYFYPDLPKGYQITQYERPLCYDGEIEIMTSKGMKHIRITRIHMEEDTGKLSHINGKTVVDYNRAGLPLMELVTEPDIRNAEEAKVFCEELQLILRYLDISDGDMDKGQMRCEVNISLREKGTEAFGTKVEIKNLNSFRVVEQAIIYEMTRQGEVLNQGGEIVQETRGWDDTKAITFSQRKKENANDYRYFVEPDIPPFETTAIVLDADSIKAELPIAKRQRFTTQYNLQAQQIETLVKNKALADYFEQVISELEAWIKTDNKRLAESEHSKLIKLSANYLLTELIKHYSEKGFRFKDSPITAENYAEFVKIVFSGEVSSTGAQTLLSKMLETGSDPSEIVEAEGLRQVSDTGALQAIVDQVILEQGKVVSDYRDGNENVIQFLVGQVMRYSKGSANPQVAKQLLHDTITQNK
ncbi:MAG: Asp-tRNA(Asn)/Glu-tRNA(Gln) amidotransferase subunit GatB [Candidatus Paceibacterota bacterium]